MFKGGGDIVEQNIFMGTRDMEQLMELVMASNAKRELLDNQAEVVRIIPEMKPCIGFQQNSPYHIYDVWGHIVTAVDEAADDYLVRMALLLHDIGKPRCYKADENGIGHFHGHGHVSAEITDAVLTRLGADPAFKERVVTLVRYHDMRIDVCSRAVSRLVGKIGEGQFNKLLLVREADVLAQAPGYERQRLDKIANLRCIKERVKTEKQAAEQSKLELSGKDLLGIGYEQGPAIGRQLCVLREMVQKDSLLNQHDVLLEQSVKALRQEKHSRA